MTLLVHLIYKICRLVTHSASQKNWLNSLVSASKKFMNGVTKIMLSPFSSTLAQPKPHILLQRIFCLYLLYCGTLKTLFWHHFA